MKEYALKNKIRIGKGTVIESTAIIQENCEIGEDCFIGHYVVLRPNTRIGNRTSVGHLTVFEGDCLVGNDCSIQAQCYITRGAVIGDKVFIASGFMGCNDKKMVYLRKHFDPEGYTIKDGVRIGGNVSIQGGITIGRNAVVGLGSVVIKDVKDNTIVYGNPATIRGIVPEEQRI